MATVYKIKIDVTSPWISYSPEYLEEKIKNLLVDGLKMEAILIKIKDR